MPSEVKLRSRKALSEVKLRSRKALSEIKLRSRKFGFINWVYNVNWPP